MTSAEKSARYRAKDVAAYRERKAEYARTPEQRALRTAYMKDWREKNRDKHNQQARESHQRNKHKHVGKVINDHYLRSYGITSEDKAAMVVAQGGCCAICKQVFLDSKKTHVDHDHETGKVRGILCNVCNTKLGWFEKYAPHINGYLAKE